MTELSAAVCADLAPGGKIRAGLNYSNFLLVGKDPASGTPSGIAVDLAQELGRRLGEPVELVGYESGGKLADAARAGGWDIAFLGADPARASDIEFTAAYLEIEATYLVPAQSPLRSIADVDRSGVRICVSAASAYELALKRSIKRAELVRAGSIDASFDLFVERGLEALAGLKPRLVMDAERLPGSRLIEGRFTAIQQAIGIPRGRDAGAVYLRDFVEEVKASGLIASVIERNNVRGVTVAPKAPVR